MIQFLAVIDAPDGLGKIENHGRGIERAEERPAAHLVASRYEMPSRVQGLHFQLACAFGSARFSRRRHGENHNR